MGEITTKYSKPFKNLLRNRWNNTPKDVVIVHGFAPSPTLPNISPFIIKVETYLRLAKIPYAVSYPYGTNELRRKKYSTPKINILDGLSGHLGS